MFGEKLDYMILRMIAHRRNIATEENLNMQAKQQYLRSADDGVTHLRKHIERFDGLFPISPNLRYLDMGCGAGELTIGLAKLGCKHITGIDFVPRNIAACESHARQIGADSAVRFICADMNNWAPLEKYDVLLSFEAFEHIDNPKGFLRKMADFMAPDGVAILGFGPLFHSPVGDHMSSFFRIQIPWRGVLFSEKAVLRVRRECFRPTDAAERYKDIVGGLNLMRYSEFLTYVRETGWHFTHLALNPPLKRLPPLHHISSVLTRIPVIRDYCVFSVYAILRRSAPLLQHE
jgi:SAM-dependent methyltransferase